MNFEYHTNRLILRLPSTDFLRELLDFQLRNRALFEKYEATRPINFYSLHYQQAVLKCELKMALKQQSIRFYIFSKQEPSHMIGTICLHNIMPIPYSCSEVGYKFDAWHQHQGYATEALAKVCDIAFDELDIHRLYARVMPENTSSIRLLQRLHFTEEGLERQTLLIQGKWTDHLRYARIRPSS